VLAKRKFLVVGGKGVKAQKAGRYGEKAGRYGEKARLPRAAQKMSQQAGWFDRWWRVRVP
jgi:hypothetical protein